MDFTIMKDNWILIWTSYESQTQVQLYIVILSVMTSFQNTKLQ